MKRKKLDNRNIGDYCNCMEDMNNTKKIIKKIRIASLTILILGFVILVLPGKEMPGLGLSLEIIGLVFYGIFLFTKWE